MAHTIPRITNARINNTPLLISRGALEEVTSYLDSRPDGLMSKRELAVARDIQAKNKKMDLGDGGVAILSVSGALTYEETMIGALCGMTSYQGLLTSMERAIEEGYKTALLDINSGGGEAYGVFETAKQLRKLADDNDIKLIAYVDGVAASAAYGLATAAHEVISNPSSDVGSIGVVVRLINDNEMLKKVGISQTYIFAGDNKIPFNEDGEFTENFLSDIQGKVDTLYSSFVSHVASFRNISEEVVKGTEASVFDADEALNLGLIDKVMERSEFADYLADISEEDGTMPIGNLFNKNKEENMTTKTEVIETPVADTVVEEVQASDNADMLAEMKEQIATLVATNEKLELSAKLKRDAELLAELEGITCVADAVSVSAILGKLDDGSRDMILASFKAADNVVASAMDTVVSTEGEAVLDTNTSHEDAQAAIEAKIAAKFNKD